MGTMWVPWGLPDSGPAIQRLLKIRFMVGMVSRWLPGAKETASEWVSVTRSWHDASFPGNELPVYCQASLRDFRCLSPLGAIGNSQVL